MKFLTLIFSLTILLISAGCQHITTTTATVVEPAPIKKKIVMSIGYGSMGNFPKAPLSQQKLLAIRGAKLDAYRNLAEEIYGIRIKGETTVKDMVVVNDGYRITINSMIRGAHLNSITEKKNGLFEAEVQMTFTPRYTQCLYHPERSCLNSSNQFQSDIVDIQGEEKHVEISVQEKQLALENAKLKAKQARAKQDRGQGIFAIPANMSHQN